MKTSNFDNIKLFIDWIITKNNVKEIIDEFEEQTDKGFVFERLFDLVIKFGYCDVFTPNNNFNHIISNVNNGIIDYLVNLQTYLTDNKVSSGNSGGASDITLYDIEKEQYIFISSKYPKSNKDIKKSKSVDYYDIQKIIAMIDDNKHIYSNYKIYLVVPNKKKVLDKVKQANKSSKYITKYMEEGNILDEEDLNKYFLKLKKDLLKYKFEDYNNVFMKKKDKLITRFHQKLINQKTSNLIDDGEKQFLWGLKCRSGKTYCCADLIRNYGENSLINVLIITPAPTETTPQFEEVFDNFMGFENFNIHSIKSSKSINELKINTNKSNIFIMSKQLLQNYTGDNTIQKIKNLKLNLIFSDENHHGSTTNLAKQIFESYSSKKTVKIYLTATYNKPLKEWGIPEHCQMYWDLEDEQICKAIYKSIEMKNDCSSSEQICKANYNDSQEKTEVFSEASHNNIIILKDDEKEILKLIEKHGPTVNEIINQYKKDSFTIQDIFKSYLNMPDLYLLSSLFDQDRYDAIKEKISDSEYGFSFDTLFSLNTSKTKFKFENDVLTFFRYISGSNKEQDFKKKDKSIFSRINKICSEKESRLPFTHIWFLPPNNINETSKSLIKVIEKDSILSQYDFYPINSKNSEIDTSKIKQTIQNYELKAKKEEKKGLILLAGNMLSLGITLSNCDVVMLFNNTLSSDKVMQQMYRCMTESFCSKQKPSTITEKDKSFSYMTEGKEKKFGFVVDLNISRVLNTCINYSIHKKDLSIEEKLKYMFDYHLMNIDADMWDNKKLDSDYLINKLLDIWKNDPLNNFKTIIKNFDNECLEFDNDTQKLLNKLFTSSANDKISATIEFKDENDESQSIQSGKETIETEESENDKELTNLEKDLLEEEKKEKEISFTKDILADVIPLSCVLTIKDSNKDFVKMLYCIKQNKELLEIFDDQSLIWWNKKNLIKIITDIAEKYINKNSDTFNLSAIFKMGLKSLLDKPKELLELINDCLKPKKLEKKKFGEVFTPMKLVNEMLDKLPTEVWGNKNLKWLDPATGMGNYPIAVYLRLMEGLKKEISNEKQRKKHIIENMLYMCELNKKNCYIIKQILNINNDYKLNLYEGDYLELNSNKKFNIEKFDIIMGNPPYQESKASGDNKLYLSFVKKSIEILNDKKYLLFITPRNIIDYLVLNEKNRKYVDKFYQINYLSIETASKYFNNIGSTFAYFLIVKENYKKETIVEYIDKNKLYTTKIKLTKGMVLPKIFNPIDLTILSKITSNTDNYDLLDFKFGNNTQRIRKQHVEKNAVSIKETKTHNIKIIDTINKSNPYPGKFYYYTNKDNDFNKNKIIISKKGYLMPFIDDKHEYTYSDNFKYIIDDNLENILILLESNIIDYLILQYSKNGFDNVNILKNLKKINLQNSKNINDIYKLYNLNNDEINRINELTSNKKNIISKKIEKENCVSDEEKTISKPKINKVKKNKSTLNKTK